MALTGVEIESASSRARGEALAQKFGVPVLDALVRAGRGVRLVVSPEGLALAFEDRTRGKPFRLDFREDLKKLPLARGHIFRRAFGTGREVIDATAGFGHDTLRALSFGCRVTAIERSPVVFALLEEAVARARADGGDLADWMSRLTLVHAEAVTELGHRRADVVYVDPMFTKLKSTAKSPKEMQLLQELFDPSAPVDHVELIRAAQGTATSRVVVKRPLKLKEEGHRPSISYTGQSVRYDVFIIGTASGPTETPLS